MHYFLKLFNDSITVPAGHADHFGPMQFAEKQFFESRAYTSGGNFYMFTDKRSYEIAKQKHHCPHCKKELSCCHTPPYHVGDGLGWGTEIFFVCLNDDCPLFNKSWAEFDERYGKKSSCRYMLLPNEKKGGPMMVASKIAFTGLVVDPETADKVNERLQKEQASVAELDSCIEKKNLEPILYLITDEDAHLEQRHRACELLDQVNELACIDPIRAHKFRHTEIGQLAEMAIVRILKSHNSIECQYCAEVIKAHAKICKHCGKETAG